MNRTSVVASVVLASVAAFGISSISVISIRGQSDSSTLPGNPWPPAVKAGDKSPALSPEDELKTFSMPPGWRAELVAAEPMIESPILIEFDPDGRLWALELLGFLPDTSGRDSKEPVNRVVVLEDTDGDGKMDKRTVFADKLVMPRALKVLDRGVLVGEPPNLWLMKDTDGDLKADTKDLVTNTYGNGNAGIEHNANALFWAMDNVMYSSEHTFDLRLKNGKFETLPALSRGQWQISQDDAGRIYRNVNDSPLYVDYTQSRYFLRNPNVVRTRGLYELLIEQMDATVYPVRSNRGINRGYREPGPFFRADGSSIVIQGAGTPTIYRGDRYPADFRGDAFITDSPTNLVHRFKIVDDGTGKLTAKNGFERGEFLASSDERFRPVNLFDAPDGTLYVVDMYRGVVQQGGIWTDYLTGYIKANDLELPVGKGRIWRMVYGNGNATRGPKPSLSKATPAQLVQTLSNPNGWWRDTAQRLLVERADPSVVPALKGLVASAPDWRTRLHALWTLDGLDAIDVASVQKAIGDASPDVRAAAIRVSERWIGQPDHPLAPAIVKAADDKSWTVRRQVGATLGELPAAARLDPATALLVKYGSDPMLVDAVVSSLKGSEAEVLKRVLQTKAGSNQPNEAVEMLAAAVTKSGDVTAVQSIVDLAANPATVAWQRQSLLEGLDAALPAGGGGRGGRGGSGLAGVSAPGGRVTITPGKPVKLAAEPLGLTKMSAGSDEISRLAATVHNKLDWPGRPAPTVVATPLTAEQQKRFAAGAELYKNLCAGCHQPDGRGKEKLGADLVDSPYVTGPDATAMIRILLHGKEGPIGLMPPLASAYNDEQIAAALTYIRREWGHTGAPVSPVEVGELRGMNKTRVKPWTDPELQQGRGGGRRGGGPGGGGADSGRGGR